MPASSHSPSNQVHLEAVRSGDREGLAKIYREFLPGVIRLVTRAGGSREDARDIFQMAIMVVFERCRKEEFELTGSFGGLLMGISRNLWGNRLQKKSFREERIDDPVKYETGEDWQELVFEEEKRQLLRDKMKQLGEDCRRVLTLFFLGESMEDIRQQLGWGSVSYAAKRKFQCKERLVNLVMQDPRYEELK